MEVVTCFKACDVRRMLGKERNVAVAYRIVRAGPVIDKISFQVEDSKSAIVRMQSLYQKADNLVKIENIAGVSVELQAWPYDKPKEIQVHMKAKI